MATFWGIISIVLSMASFLLFIALVVGVWRLVEVGQSMDRTLARIADTRAEGNRDSHA